MISWSRTDAPSTLVEAASDIERDVEDTYGVAVELVVVGDCALDDSIFCCFVNFIRNVLFARADAAVGSGRAPESLRLTTQEVDETGDDLLSQRRVGR